MIIINSCVDMNLLNEVKSYLIDAKRVGEYTESVRLLDKLLSQVKSLVDENNSLIGSIEGLNEQLESWYDYDEEWAE